MPSLLNDKHAAYGDFVADPESSTRVRGQSAR
jgi:hypothetical protein